MKKSPTFFTVVLITALFLSRCGSTQTIENTSNQAEDEQLTIYTTIFPLEDFSKKKLAVTLSK